MTTLLYRYTRVLYIEYIRRSIGEVENLDRIQNGLARGPDGDPASPIASRVIGRLVVGERLLIQYLRAAGVARLFKRLHRPAKKKTVFITI